jgi:hypothetical protein
MIAKVNGQENQTEVQQMLKYQNMMAAQQWDQLIAQAKTDVLPDQLRILVDTFLVIAYQAKKQYQEAFLVSKENCQKILRMGMAANKDILPCISFYAELLYKYGTTEDADTALMMLNMHKGDTHTANLDNNNSLLFHRGMAYAHLKKEQYIEAIANAEVWLQILKNMGYPTQDAEGLIAFAKKNQSTNA